VPADLMRDPSFAKTKAGEPVTPAANFAKAAAGGCRVIKAGLRRKAAPIRREIVATPPHFRASMTQVNFVSS